MVRTERAEGSDNDTSDTNESDDGDSDLETGSWWVHRCSRTMSTKSDVVGCEEQVRVESELVVDNKSSRVDTECSLVNAQRQ